MTEKKTTTKRSVTRTKKEVNPVEEVVTKEEPIKEEVKKTKPIKKNYSSDDVIPCQSITNGELVFTSKKTGSEYFWGGIGDVCDISYEDLLYLKSKRSKFLFAPYFIMLENPFTDNKQLTLINECYEKLTQMEDFLNDELAVRKFIVDDEIPIGLKRMVAEEVSKKVREGSFINLNIINLLDKTLGLDLKMYVM